MVTADVVIRFCTYISSLQKMTDLVACEGSPCYPKSDKSLKAFPLPIGGGRSKSSILYAEGEE